MKKLVTTTALLMLLTTSIASAQDRTQEYRMWSAEQMINRLIEKFGRTNAACNQAKIQTFLPKLSEICTQAVANAYPILGIIREIAASGDEVRWAHLIDIVHTMEAGIEAPLNHLEGKGR